MNAIRIQRRHEIRPDAERWQSDDGRSLRQWVGAWLELQFQLDRLLPTSPAAEMLLTGDACGWLEQRTQSQPCDILLTQAGATACLSEVGIECATPAGLHHVLVDLVEEGCLAADVERCELPGCGSVLVYRFDGHQLGIGPRVLERAASV